MEFVFHAIFLILLFCGIMLVFTPVRTSVNDSIKTYWPTVILIGLTLLFIVCGFPILRNQRINQWIKDGCRPIDVPMEYYNVAIAQNNAKAMESRARYYSNKGDNSRAKRWLLMAAKHGNINAQKEIAENFKRDSKYEEAVKWYSKAIENGAGANVRSSLAFCQYKVGEQYEMTQAWGVAANWYWMAAARNNKWAQYRLGWCYFNGRGVPLSYNEAIRWFKKSAKQNHKKAYYALGYCYRKGYGVIQSDSQAIKYYEAAAAQGVVEAMFELGKLYEARGDSSNAVKWYRKAAEQGHVGAKQRLQELGE